ncbi:hypothetical protein HMPREF0381_2551 [Lachnoanaerobaculum saburreum DSM 3986]|uniref:Uncharacterized protein n=1 Tax=Lachnoanaerobaculum saburreum DSM 3986 TaxID=887325 RepID=E6LRG6_9FIRM|nr:hypothetical protein HMPREF0381_2551 [Lachnoanaerobaculum saburreum DSM 3986]
MKYFHKASLLSNLLLFTKIKVYLILYIKMILYGIHTKIVYIIQNI